MSTPIDQQDLLVLFASENGNTARIANNIASDLSDHVTVTLKAISDISFTSLSSFTSVYYLTSTYGQGVPPTMAKPFHMWLRDQVATHTDEQVLSGVKFAVLGIGSSRFGDNFCKAAVEIDSFFSHLGATRQFELVKANETQPLDFEASIQGYSRRVFDVLGIHRDPSSKPVPTLRVLSLPRRKERVKAPLPGYELVTLSHSVRIVPDTAPRSARLLHFDFSAKSKTTYTTGDHMSILPRNNPAAVAALVERLGLDPEDQVRIGTLRKRAVPPGLTKGHTIREIFTQYLDIHGPAGRGFLRQLVPFAGSEEDKEELQRLVSQEAAPEFKSRISDEGLTYCEVLMRYQSVRIGLEFLVEYIPAQRARLYSIASSHVRHPRQVQLVVGIVQWTTRGGTSREGLTTGYLRRLKVEDAPQVAIAIKSSALKYPDDPLAPIVAIGLGSGMAPFRGFLQQRESMHEAGIELGPMHFYFGCRRRDEDALCLLKLDYWQRMGIYTLITAYSREQTHKVYVTDRMRENPKIIADALLNGGSLFYCGLAGVVPSDITVISQAAIVAEGGHTPEEAEELWNRLIESGHVCLEFW